VVLEPARGHLHRAFAGLWLIVGLAPALYLRNFGNGDFVRDRYMYFAVDWIRNLIGDGAPKAAPVWRWSRQTVQVGAIVVLSVSYVCASLVQQVYWGDDLLLLVRGQELYPDILSHGWFGEEYSQRGAHDAAIELARSAVKPPQNMATDLLALAETLIRAGRYRRRSGMVDRCVNPEYAEIRGWDGWSCRIVMGKWVITNERLPCALKF